MLDASHHFMSTLWLATWSSLQPPRWVLLQVNFDPIQKIVPKVGGGHSFEGWRSMEYVYKHNWQWSWTKSSLIKSMPGRSLIQGIYTREKYKNLRIKVGGGHLLKGSIFSEIYGTWMCIVVAALTTMVWGQPLPWTPGSIRQYSNLVVSLVCFSPCHCLSTGTYSAAWLEDWCYHPRVGGQCAWVEQLWCTDEINQRYLQTRLSLVCRCTIGQAIETVHTCNSSPPSSLFPYPSLPFLPPSTLPFLPPTWTLLSGQFAIMYT